jgi:hypothetical protein
MSSQKIATLKSSTKWEATLVKVRQALKTNYTKELVTTSLWEYKEERCDLYIAASRNEPIIIGEDQSPGEIQRINHNGDTRFFSRGSRACWHASPRCVDQHLVVQWLRGIVTNLVHTLDTARTYPQVRWLNDMSNPLELPFGSPPGKVQDPSQSLEPAMNNHQHVPMLLCCSKPSRWRQPPRVTRILQPQRSPSATRCNHSSKCTWNHS